MAISSVKFSIELAVKCPVTELPEYLRQLDSSGFHRVWVPDAPISQWELWSAAALAVANTSRIRVGIGVTSPYHRSPAVIAHAIATLEHLSQGRIDLSLGRGVRPFLQRIGLEGSDAGVAEAVEIIGKLLRGEKLTYNGQDFRFDQVQLPLTSYQERVPVLIAAMSEKWMEVAANVADGIHTYSVNQKLLKTALKWAGRSPRADFSVVTSVAYIEPKEARDWWLDNRSRSYNLMSLMGMEAGKVDSEELAQNLTFSDYEDLRRKVKELERLGVAEIMIAYRRPEDVSTLCQFVGRLV